MLAVASLIAPTHATFAQSVTPPPVTPPPVAPPAAAQNPSPMTESTRPHERLVQRPLKGTMRSFAGPAGKPVELFVPDDGRSRDAFDLVVHFHGAGWLPALAASSYGRRTVAATLNLGSGSGVYGRAFTDPSVFDSLTAFHQKPQRQPEQFFKYKSAMRRAARPFVVIQRSVLGRKMNLAQRVGANRNVLPLAQIRRQGFWN